MSAALIEYLKDISFILKGLALGITGLCCIALVVSIVDEDLRLSYSIRKALLIVIAVALLIIVFLPTGKFWELL